VKTVFTDAYIKSNKKPGRYIDASTKGAELQRQEWP
jgi:hypothetical protein